MEKSKGTQQRAQWASSLGFILATAGSAVGLGNIWKFPGKAYEGGGAAFIIVYILIVAFLGMSIMLAEFAVGRRGQKNPAAAFQKIGHGRGGWIGKLSLITAFIILSYYSQVGGWVLKYIEGYLMESGTLYADPTGYFLGMLGSSGMPWQSAVIYPAIFLAMVVFTIIRGVEEGIERMSKILMPGLFLLLIVLTVRAVTLPGAAEGLSYLLRPDWSKLSFQMVLVALGQAFYSLSLGMAIITTYGSYVSRQENLVKHTAIICSLDTVVAIMAAFMVIPAVFAMGVASLSFRWRRCFARCRWEICLALHFTFCSFLRPLPRRFRCLRGRWPTLSKPLAATGKRSLIALVLRCLFWEFFIPSRRFICRSRGFGSTEPTA